MNIQIVKPQPGPQAAFIQCTADVVCYGGARGGGKSWAIALDFWLHAERHGEDARGLILRKTREDLKDFIDTAGHMYAGSARYSEKGNFSSDIVAIGRVKWIEGSKFTGKDIACWYKFNTHGRPRLPRARLMARYHPARPVFAPSRGDRAEAHCEQMVAPIFSEMILRAYEIARRG